jgi:ABC-type sugar transport system ATPase subunit
VTGEDRGSSVRLRSVTKRFGAVEALAGVSVDVDAGEFFCVLGPPGAGKTTLLRTIVGLEQPSAGAVEIDGRDVTAVPPSRRGVGMVFQNLALYADKTVYENIAFPLRESGEKLAKGEVDTRVRETAALLHITHLLDRRPGTCSGGERQRVAIGRAIVRRPRIYLLDEPLSALDALLRIEMRAELKRLQRELARTVVYVTHDQVEAMSMADRVCVLDRGRVQQVGAPMHVYRHPANTFVARTVGTPPINLVPVDVTASNGAATLRHPAFSIASPALARAAAGTAILGVRPEDVRIGEEARSPLLTCEVIAVEPLGSETIVDLDLQGGILKVIVSPTRRIHVQERVPVEFALERALMFDADGNALR